MTDPKIIVALDSSTKAQALQLAQNFSPDLCRVKVGLELFTNAGPDIVRQLINLGFQVFLDLKFHDIPNTVARACRAAAELGIWMINVHTLGGTRMLDAAREAIEASGHKPLLLGVTVLTSHSELELTEIGLAEDAGAMVRRLAGLARSSGLNGVVCSPHEAAALRTLFGPDFVLVTPGVRPAGSDANDQRRFMTPSQALAQGADYLVIGRPITASDDPKTSLTSIISELNTT